MFPKIRIGEITVVSFGNDRRIGVFPRIVFQSQKVFKGQTVVVGDFDGQRRAHAPVRGNGIGYEQKRSVVELGQADAAVVVTSVGTLLLASSSTIPTSSYYDLCNV